MAVAGAREGLVLLRSCGPSDLKWDCMIRPLMFLTQEMGNQARQDRSNLLLPAADTRRAFVVPFFEVDTIALGFYSK